MAAHTSSSEKKHPATTTTTKQCDIRSISSVKRVTWAPERWVRRAEAVSWHHEPT